MLGLDYVKMDACPNDCILYYKGYKDIEVCPKFKVPRWKGEKALLLQANQIMIH